MDKSIISKGQADQLYKTLKFINDTFIKNKITYFMVGGTLLGAIRHQGVIPWDDDGDLCILKKDVPKLEKLIPYFKKNGYFLEEGVNDENDEEKDAKCTKRKNSCTWYIGCDKKNCLGVDIFVMYEKGNKITYYDPYWETAENGGKKCYFDKNLVYPILPLRFGNFYMYAPQNALDHLNRCYGDDWTSKGQVLFDHRTGKWKHTKKRKLTSNEFLTFKPPTSTKDSNVPPIIEEKKQKYFSKSK
jgi:lipopolysaccharide cholinephosphotransferase